MDRRTSGRRSPQADAYRRLYKTAAWRTLRASILLRDRYTCRWPGCGKLLIGSRHQHNAPVVHHRRDHKGDHRLFFDPLNLISVCKACHDAQAQAETATGYIRGASTDGRPLDPHHPWNRP